MRFIFVLFCFCWITIYSIQGDQSLCPLIFEYAREPCSANTEGQCRSAGCCWDADAKPRSMRCYKKECQDGYFGYGCRFECRCVGNAVCDKHTGACPNNTCMMSSWGVGCMLDNDCTYNDPYGLQYLGSKSVTENGKSCKPWSVQMAYPDAQFPEKNKTVASNYCRNPQPADYRTWCYYRYGSNPRDRRWQYCSLAPCDCPVGRWGINCVGECHCSSNDEQCDQTTGQCDSGCAQGWFGSNCQDCADGSFGVLCQKQCRCSDAAEVCDKNTGHCVTGCDAGWWGDDCQKECEDNYFGLRCEYDCNCADTAEACNKTTGACSSGCTRGFAGEGCLLALSPVCESKCGDPYEPCPAQNMHCKTGCAPGWAGTLCNLEVPEIKRTPQLVGRTSKSFEVKWRKWRNPPDQGDGPVSEYIVQYKPVTVNVWERVTTTLLQLNITGLIPGELYQVTIVPVHEQGFEGLGSPNLNVSTCGVPLGKVSSLRLTFSDDKPLAPELDSSVENSDLELGYIVASWRPAYLNMWGCDSVVKYKVYLLSPRHLDFTFYGETSTTTTISIGNIDQFSNYTIAVTFVNNMGFESEKAIRTIIGKCGPVQNMVVQPEVDALGVYWERPLHTNGAMETYLLRYRHLKLADCEAPKKNWLPIIDIPLSFNSYTVTDLRPYSQYEVRVWVRTAAGKGEQVTEKVYTQAIIPSGQVENLKHQNLTAVLSSFTWELPPCDSRNGLTAGYTVKLFSIDNHDQVIQSHTVNQTSITLKNLIPYESYLLEVAYLNQIGSGPTQTLGFRTLEDVPPPPSNLHLKLTLSDRLGIAWDPPDPPHGLILKYELQHWKTSSTQAKPPVELASDRTQFLLSELPPNVSYAFQVRAYTSKGAGDWTSTVYGFTEETYPTEPQSLRNTSRSTNEITLEWKPPLKPNGILRDYKVECLPKRALGRYLTSDHTDGDSTPQAFVSDEAQKYTMRDLIPGTEYSCEVRASTRKGFGPPIKRTFFTEPQKPKKPTVPVLERTASTDTTITLNLHSTEYVILNVENSVIRHRVVVEKLRDTERTSGGKTKRSSESLPCDESHVALTDYFGAVKRGKNCYIAAELPRLDRRKAFIVGDNKTYGVYYNAPLEKDKSYGIWFSVAVTVDGITSASYTKLDDPVVAAKYTESHVSPASSRLAVLAGVAAGVILLVVLIALFLVIFITKKRKRGCNIQQEIATRTESEGLTSSPRVSHHEKSSTLDPLHPSDSEPDDHALIMEKPAPRRRPIATENLWNYVRDKKSSKSNGFKQEYEEIPQGLIAMSECARRPESRNLNRYGNIIAYDHSRVILKNCTHTASDYINANYIDAYCRPNAWIATQGPSKYTLNDMWHMVWQERSHRIIMVTNLIEDGRHKCDQYWPDLGSKVYGNITVEKLEEEQFADFTIRTFNMVKQDVETPRIVRQFHFTAWPDHGCPTYATSLIAFRKKVRSYDDPTAGPTTVHCSAGVGRTGTFIALDSLLDGAKNESVVDVYNVVHCMRSKRVNMVQTQEQYEFVYEALLEALKSGDTAIPCRDFRKRYLDLLQDNPDTGKQRLAEEYELLSVMTPPVTTTGCKDAADMENTCKNRTQEIIPLNNLARPYLMTYIPGSSDYINAVFSDGYKHRDAFIITQMPLPQTVVDFWAMCYDHECSAVVMMNELDMADPSCMCYYPAQAGSQTYGPFTIETVALDSTYPDITIRDMTLGISKKGSEPRKVRQFQYHGWPQDQTLPLRRPSVIQLLQLLEKWQQRSGNKTIVVHCMDGATHSGLLCAISYMIERLKVEQEVDVFNSVKHTRINRPQLVPSLEQYQFMYEMAEEYMDCFDTYANFK